MQINRRVTVVLSLMLIKYLQGIMCENYQRSLLHADFNVNKLEQTKEVMKTVNRKTDNKMTNRKGAKRQAMVDKLLQRRTED